MSTTYQTLRDAIANRQQIVCQFDGYTREICPHAIGRKNGVEQLMCFQFAGGSSKGLPPGGQWRCLPVAKIMNPVARAGDWHTGTGHSRPNTCVDEIDLQISY